MVTRGEVALCSAPSPLTMTPGILGGYVSMTSVNSTFCFCVVVVVPNKLLLLAQLTSHSGLCPGAHPLCGITPHAFVTSLLAHDTGASPPSRLRNGHHDIRMELGSIWQQDNTRVCRAIWQERGWGRRREGRAARREVLAARFLTLWSLPKTDGRTTVPVPASSRHRQRTGKCAGALP